MKIFLILAALIGKISTGESYLQIGKILIQWGTVTLTCSGAETNTERDAASATVTFPKEYETPPTPFISLYFLSNYLSQCGAQEITTKDMVIGMSHTRTGEPTSLPTYWLTIGEAKEKI